MFVLRVLSSLQGSLVTPLQGRFPLLSFLCGCFSVVCRLCLQSLHHYLCGSQRFVFQVCVLLSELPLGLSNKPFCQLPLAFPVVAAIHICLGVAHAEACLLEFLPLLTFDMPSKIKVFYTRNFRTTHLICISGPAFAAALLPL